MASQPYLCASAQPSLLSCPSSRRAKPGNKKKKKLQLGSRSLLPLISALSKPVIMIMMLLLESLHAIIIRHNLFFLAGDRLTSKSAGIGLRAATSSYSSLYLLL